MALLHAAMDKQKENDLDPTNPHRKIKMPDTHQTEAMIKWGKQGDIPLDVSRVKIKGRGQEEAKVVEKADT